MDQDLEGANWLGPFPSNRWKADYEKAINGEVQEEEANGGVVQERIIVQRNWRN